MRRETAALLMVAAAIGAARDVAAQDGEWRRIATSPDRERLRQWRHAWRAALPAAREGGGAAAITANRTLFDPDRATEEAMPPPGSYRCRTFRLGGGRPEGSGPEGGGTGRPAFSAAEPARCRVSDAGEFVVQDGAARANGRLYPDTAARAVFLGTTVLADERRPMRYGRDARRDAVGLVERIGTTRWRLVMPYPRFGSVLDVVEMVPADG